MWTAYLDYWIVMICGFLFVCAVCPGNCDKTMAISDYTRFRRKRLWLFETRLYPLTEQNLESDIKTSPALAGEECTAAVAMAFRNIDLTHFTMCRVLSLPQHCNG